MNAGLSGFKGAPVSRALVTAVLATSLFVQMVAKNLNRRRSLVLDSFISGLAFHQPGELFFGVLLLYYFRLFERQMGIGKFGAYVLFILFFGFSVERFFLITFQRDSARGLYPLIFSNMVAFLLEVPPLHRFSLFGIQLSEKMFVYVSALQLLLSDMPRTVVAGLSGTLAGLVYSSGLLSIQQLLLPQQVEAFLVRMMDASPTPLPSGRTDRPLNPRSHSRAGGTNRAGGVVEPSPELLQRLTDMGFDPSNAAQALRQTNNNIELALQSLL
jgi:hypothetical protein